MEVPDGPFPWSRNRWTCVASDSKDVFARGMFHTRNQVKPADCFKLKRAVMRQLTGPLPITKIPQFLSLESGCDFLSSASGYAAKVCDFDQLIYMVRITSEV